MALKITRAADPITVERLNVTIYSQPGAGKTSLAFTAEAPLLLDFDRGIHRAANRGDAVQVTDWRDVASMTGEDLADYKTVVMDTAGRALDILAADIIRIDPKKGNGGSLSLKGFGELKSRFAGFLKMLNSFGKDVVLIVHGEEKQSGDDIIERLDMQGASKNEVYKSSDMMGRLVIREGKRWLLFSPTDTAFGKNPGQLEPIQIPPIESPEYAGLLGRVIAQTKEKLNALSDEQREAMAEQEWFREALPKIQNAEEVNALLPRAKAAGVACSTLLARRAKEMDLSFDKQAGEYVELQKEAA